MVEFYKKKGYDERKSFGIALFVHDICKVNKTYLSIGIYQISIHSKFRKSFSWRQIKINQIATKMSFYDWRVIDFRKFELIRSDFCRHCRQFHSVENDCPTRMLNYVSTQ